MRSTLSAIEERFTDPTARGLARAVSQAIHDGVLVEGAPLPPIRMLAHELALSPTTVSAAWSILTRAGAIRTAGRHGTFVSGRAADTGVRYPHAVEHLRGFRLDLSTGVPDAELLPALGPALRALTTAGTPQSYLDDPVLPALDAELRRSWPYPPPALTLVDGAMDGLDLVVRALVRYGDRVVVEHPTFPPILDLLGAAGAEVVGVPLDEEGPDPDALRRALTEPVRALLVQPRAQNPTGVSLSARRARALAAVLAESDAVVVEDDSTGALCGAPDISLGAALPTRTVHLRSYSKSHGPDLRLAAMSGPVDLMGRIAALRQLGQGWSSRLLQRMLLALLTDEESVRAVHAAGGRYADRRTRFVDVLAAHGIEVAAGDGLNVWVPVHDESAALMHLAAAGIGVAPGAPFRVLPGPGGNIRVTTGLIGDDLDDIEEVAAVVAAAARTTGRHRGAR